MNLTIKIIFLIVFYTLSSYYLFEDLPSALIIGGFLTIPAIIVMLIKKPTNLNKQ